MECIPIKLQYGFIVERVKFTWHDAVYALGHGFIDEMILREHAENQAVRYKENECPQVLIDIMIMDECDSISSRADELLKLDSDESEQPSREKCLFLILDALYERKNELDDVLDTLEAVYAGFDYPEELNTLIRYMPSDEPDLGSVELNANRIFDKWKSLLDKMRARYLLKPYSAN